MIIKQVKNNIYNNKYLEDREKVWNKKIVEYKSKNMPLWNGSVYYLDKIEKKSINIGLCEYKDLIFLGKKGLYEIKKRYDLEFSFIYLNVQIFIKDKKDRYLFGTKHHRDYVEIISVGGTLRLEDGKEIKSFKDILNYAKKEILIETKIKIESNLLNYIDMVINNDICTFLFEYKVNNLDANLLNMGEFDGSVIMRKSNIFNEKKFKASDRLESLKKYFLKYD
jgi:hypothetical protein